MLDTLSLLEEWQFPSVARRQVEVLQVNLGYRCNLQCLHCHVDASPGRSEMMQRNVIEDIVRFLEKGDIKTLDLTGGAPEMNIHFCYLVESAKALGVHVIDRCNLTILEELGYKELANFLALNEVEVVASLPCYLEDNVDKQRGRGTFAASIKGLLRLNSLGYGKPMSGLVLNLVYNPQGPALPPPQAALESDYRRHLTEKFGIEFNQLFTLTNMPIKRFGSMLVSKGEFKGYMQLLNNAYSSDNLENLMCRNQLSVDWQGFVYDCDFNQMLNLPLQREGKSRWYLSELAGGILEGEAVVVKGHCYGCAAGQGSSCGGALEG